jgi:hypothetical protein
MKVTRSTIFAFVAVGCIGVPSTSIADRQAEAAERLFGVIEAEQTDVSRSPANASAPRRSSIPAAVKAQPGRARRNTVCEFENISLRDTQSLLAELDLYGGAVDGIWGRQTENAIKEAKNLINSSTSTTCLDSSEITLLTEIVSAKSPNVTHNQANYAEPDNVVQQEMREAAEVFISDLESFIVGGGQGFDVTFPVRFSEVRDVSGDRWNEMSSARFADFRDYALLNQSFSTYQQQKAQERAENYLRDLQLSKDRITASLVTIRTWISANLLDPRAAEAAQTLLSAEGVVESRDLQVVLGFQEQVEGTINLILGDSILMVESAVMPAFEVSSIFVFANFSGRGENIFKNLGGDIEFDRSEAVVCLVGDVDIWGRYEVISKLKESLSINQIDVLFSDCSYTSDLIAVSGIALAGEGGVSFQSQPNLEQIREITRAEVLQRRQRLEITSQTIEDEIFKGARNGYGLILHNASNHNVCMIVGGESQDHIAVVDGFADILGIYFDSRLSYAVSLDSLEAFRKIQSRECGTVYGNEETLLVLLNAFKVNELQYSVLPFWVDQNSLSQQAERRRETEAQALAFEQERQSNSALRSAVLGDIAARSAVLQDELRRQYSTRFLSMTSSLSEILLEAVDFGFSSSPLSLDYQERLESLEYSDGSIFPTNAFEKVINEAQELSLAQWELRRTLVERVDYGSVQFNGRQLDAVIVDMQLSLANRILGEFRTYCRSVRAVLDDDFDLWRLVELGECGNDGDAWKLSANFESRWIVDGE